MQGPATATEDLVRVVECAPDAVARRRAATLLLGREAIADFALRADLRSRLHKRFLSEPDLHVAALLGRVENRVHMREIAVPDGGIERDPILGEHDVETLREEIRRVAEMHDRVKASGKAFAERFDVLGIHRRGGMAVVLEAIRAEDGRRVAIKRLLEELAGRATVVERFRREAALLAGLRHPRIVPLLEWGGSNGDLYLVLDWMPGGTLKERGPDASPRQRISWLAEAADGLAFAHAQGVIHRDLKPSNILIDADGRARLTDFGLARKWNEAVLTPAGAVLGTPGYMAPEQESSPDSVGPAADVFALGVMARDLDPDRRAPAEIRNTLFRATEPDPLLRPSAMRLRDALLRWVGA